MTDEWGGGTGPMCQAGSMMELGGNTIITLDADDKKQTQHALLQASRPRSRREENCVSHNGGIIPVPGTRPLRAGLVSGRREHHGLHERGPVPSRSGTSTAVRSIRRQGRRRAAAGGGSTRSVDGEMRNTIGGSWGAYYWNGMIYSSELDRGWTSWS